MEVATPEAARIDVYKRQENGNVSFTEARLVLECRKLYAEPLNPEAFVDKSMVSEWYAAGDFHKMYIVESLNVWVKE